MHNLQHTNSSPLVRGAGDRRTRTDASCRVALVLPRTGPAGIFGPQCLAAAELAATEIEATGGIGGRAVEFVHLDAGRPPAQVARDVALLLHDGAIDAISGWHLSNTRQAIARVVRGSIPYVYAAAYEGGENSDGVVCSGEVPIDQILASLQWFRRERALQRWYIVGNDYIWPRGTAAATRKGLEGSDVGVVAECYLPLGTEDDSQWDATCAAVARAEPDGVLSLLVGSDAVRFNRAFARHQLDACITRFSPFTDETVVLASGAEATGDLYISAGWFAGLDSASATDFTTGFARAFDLIHGTGPIGVGAAPPPGTMAETTYSGLKVLAGMARDGMPSVDDARRVLESWGWDSPHGPVDLRDGSARHRVHLAAADGVGLDVIARVN
ncbi:substrate-binding domain-containing protein [Gordonia metallireducens]|uniref:substrate-binding domain-containing protein n=1 Tax=Gordonia metallireducens TaxID=2897779 RepID=UPI0027E0B2A9|nr:substrate-binding domain-containing protein [Gordonia metallireducens]